MVIIGTGLSMVDQALSLLNKGHRGPILAYSRRGLLPLPHAASKPLARAWLSFCTICAAWLIRRGQRVAPGAM